jgi:single-stranded-DNA-specific exonuclease
LINKFGDKRVKNKRKVWSLKYVAGNSEADKVTDSIACELGISEITARLIYNRGYTSVDAASAFIDGDADYFHDPYMLKDMDKAVERITRAVSNGERITIYGDYDVDGVTSVTVLYLYLKSLGATVDYYIPLRAKEGYGLSRMAIDTLRARGTEFIITVDTGITASDEVEYARTLGIEMVITDHHECHGDIPAACAAVNPHRPDCKYPFKELAGVGVVFKLVCALEMQLNRGASKEECIRNVCREYIDAVAIGTVADVMPLVDENRNIVRQGLAAIADSKRCGLAALIEAASAPIATHSAVGADKYLPKKRKINSGFISFTLAPRINAAGRISSAQKAVELLLEQDCDRAAVLAQELCEINLQRQREENSIADQAYRMIEQTCDLEHDKVIVLNDDSWQQGIIGIVSSRITEKYGLPSILISFDGATRGYSSDDDIGKGSGRSVKGINLVDALSHCSDLLVQFGGHELAAGLSVMRCNIGEFRKRINEYAREHLPDDAFASGYEADCEISPAIMDISLVDEISRLEPFGISNQTPLFVVRDLTLDKIISMGAGKHSKLLLGWGNKRFEAVCFGMPASTLEYFCGEKLEILCQLGANEFRGQRNLQLVVQDIRLCRELEAQYQRDALRYAQISDGAEIEDGEDVVPTRAEIAEVYRFLRYENMCGHTVFSYRSLGASLTEHMGRAIDGAKLRFILKILVDINVCECEAQSENYFCLEVCKDAVKTNIESSQTYRMLCEKINRT